MKGLDKKKRLKSQFTRARRNARTIQRYVHDHCGDMAYRVLKQALHEKHYCAAKMKPFDRMVGRKAAF